MAKDARQDVVLEGGGCYCMDAAAPVAEVVAVPVYPEERHVVETAKTRRLRDVGASSSLPRCTSSILTRQRQQSNSEQLLRPFIKNRNCIVCLCLLSLGDDGRRLQVTSVSVVRTSLTSGSASGDVVSRQFKMRGE